MKIIFSSSGPNTIAQVHASLRESNARYESYQLDHFTTMFCDLEWPTFGIGANQFWWLGILADTRVPRIALWAQFVFAIPKERWAATDKILQDINGLLPLGSLEWSGGDRILYVVRDFDPSNSDYCLKEEFSGMGDWIGKFSPWIMKAGETSMRSVSATARAIKGGQGFTTLVKRTVLDGNQIKHFCGNPSSP